MKELDEEWEAILYDTYAAMTKHAKPMCELVNDHGTLEQKAAYRDGIYAQSVRLGVFLGQDALDRGKARHEQIEIEVKAAMARYNSENVEDYRRSEGRTELIDPTGSRPDGKEVIGE